MNEYSILQSNAQLRTNARSMGVKLIVVCGLALLMAIPGLFVEALVNDRGSRAAAVVQQISDYAGGQQTFLGPTLAIPYVIPQQSSANPSVRDIYWVFPTVASGALKTATEKRHRSLFKVPVFQADLKLDATFDLAGVPTAAPRGAELDWSRAEIVVGVSNGRGALGDATLTVEGKTIVLVPADIASDVSFGGDQNAPMKLTLFGARIDTVVKPNARFNVTSSLRFSGAQRVAVLAYGKTTRVSAQGDWPNPGFDGGFLPAHRTLVRDGFSADWFVPFIARGVRAEGPGGSFAGFGGTARALHSSKLPIPISPSADPGNICSCLSDLSSCAISFLKFPPASEFIPHNTFWSE